VTRLGAQAPWLALTLAVLAIGAVVVLLMVPQ
jgi:hypothetical protein